MIKTSVVVRTDNDFGEDEKKAAEGIKTFFAQRK